jgi:hypothetical protein
MAGMLPLGPIPLQYSSALLALGGAQCSGSDDLVERNANQIRRSEKLMQGRSDSSCASEL